MSDAWTFGILLLWLPGISLSLRAQSAATGRVECKLDILLKHAAIDVEAAVDNEVERLIKEGRKRTAVTYYCELSGAEKKTANQHVDEIELRLLQQKLQNHITSGQAQ